MTALAKEKFERVERRVIGYVPEDARFARIVLNSAPNEMFTVKANVNFGGKEFFSDKTDYTLESAIVRTVEELLQMMEKEKEIKLDKNKTITDELLQEADSAVE